VSGEKPGIPSLGAALGRNNHVTARAVTLRY